CGGQQSLRYGSLPSAWRDGLSVYSLQGSKEQSCSAARHATWILTLDPLSPATGERGGLLPIEAPGAYPSTLGERSVGAPGRQKTLARRVISQNHVFSCAGW
ncbi:MAG TPA: hypothetical protein VLE20_16645, partial [Blastocatellia bacterium]|nr:hypothetical protein [Blastocatellia bacterium]